MPFISNGIYDIGSSDPNAMSPKITKDLITLSAEFCNTRLYRYEYAMSRVYSASGPYLFTEEPYFVIGSDFYIAGMVGDPTLSTTDKTIHFTIYHMDTQTFTDGSIPIPWYSSYSRENKNNSYSDYYIIQPIKHISGLKFYAFIIEYYKSSNAYANTFLIVDYENLTATKISDIPSSYQKHHKMYHGIQSKIFIGSWYVGGSSTTYLYQLNTSTGAYTQMTYDSDAAILSQSFNNKTISAVRGYSYYPSNNYRMLWYYAEDIEKNNETEYPKTESNNVNNYSKENIEIVDSHARLIPHHFRRDLPYFMYIDCCANNLQCTISKIDRFDTDNNADNNTCHVTHLLNTAQLEYVNNSYFRTYDVSNFEGYKTQVRPPMVIDYSNTNVVYGLGLLYMGYGDTCIAKYTLNMEGE